MEDKKIYYKTGYKYQLVKDAKFELDIRPEKEIKTTFLTLDTDGTLHIASGYSWDGPSGPTIDTRNFMRGSLVHDALYQLMRMELITKDNRKQADEKLKKVCREDGMTNFRSWYIVKSLSTFGSPAADPKNLKQVIVAPKD